MVNVLFVCLGNICRSPMAEAVFRDLVAKENLANKINIDSAGTASWHTGKIPHEGTRNLLDEKGISYVGMKARQVNQEDFAKYDYIIVMDDSNLTDVESQFTYGDEVIVKKLLDFVDEPKEVNVPDPYYTGDFNYTYELVMEATNALLTEIKNKNKF